MEKEKFDYIIGKCLEEKSDKNAFAIFIDGKRFKNYKGRSSWSTRNIALAALKYQIEGRAMSWAKSKYIENCQSPCYSIPSEVYKDAYEDFMRELKQEHTFEVVELKVINDYE